MKTPSVLSLLLALAFSHNLSVGQTTPSVSIDTMAK